jgi:transcriptional regulator GlxA family with amidase domain
VANQEVSDIVMGDIKMPETGEIKSLRRIEKDTRTSHKSLVILTTKSDIIPKLSDIENCADGYLLLMFDEIELQVIKENLNGFRRKFLVNSVSTALDEIKDQTVKSYNDRFMQKIIHLMDSNLDNDQYDIVDLCHSLGMSRAQIYRKFKSIIDRTPHDYMRSYRLQKAKQLLLTTKLNVSEVAYRTGFKNVSHFSRIFSKMFGKNPSEFIR